MSADLEFENLVQLYYRDLYRFGLSLTGSEADAADLTQETFYIWANKGHQLQKPASVKGWALYDFAPRVSQNLSPPKPVFE